MVSKIIKNYKYRSYRETNWLQINEISNDKYRKRSNGPKYKITNIEIRRCIENVTKEMKNRQISLAAYRGLENDHNKIKKRDHVYYGDYEHAIADDLLWITASETLPEYQERSGKILGLLRIHLRADRPQYPATSV